MIEKKTVVDIVNAYMADSAFFLVDVTITPDNFIVVVIDHDQMVGIDDCVELSHYIEAQLDRDVEDYELEVTSAGLTSPFKMVRQYLKNIGNEVEMMLVNGEKLHGWLKLADEQGVVITVEKKVKPLGAKRKEIVREDEIYRYEEIKYTKNKIRFK